jgi:hypothetical protein
MAYTVELPLFQVETSNGNNIYYDIKSAEKKYIEHCEENIPCEIYKDGLKIKEYKPLF